jgi:hypothetical protein
MMLGRHVLKRWSWCLGIGVCCALVGCTPESERRFPIDGTVSLDGRPVHNATIVFTPRAEGLASAGSIVQGEFKIEAEFGPTRGDFDVQINPVEGEMPEPTAGPEGQASDDVATSIPPIYQVPGKLSVQIDGQPNQTVHFQLSSTEQ